MSESSEVKLISSVDVGFLAQAEGDIYRILLSQRRAFNQRWHQHTIMNKLKKWLRIVAMLLCLLGALIMVVAMVLGADWRLSHWQEALFIGFFVLALVFFYRLPWFEKKMQAWTDRISQKSCKKLAKRCIKGAVKMCPFEAVYEIKGRTISYYRNQQPDQPKDQWSFVWNRSMNDCAVQGLHATVFFKKATAIQPKIVVLHTDKNPLAVVLNEQGINSTCLSE